MNLIIPSFLIFSNIISFSLGKILFVYELSRHGTRAPDFGISNDKSQYEDIYKEQWYSNGEITNIGLRMHYILGVSNKIKYSSLLSSKFDPREVIVVSTPFKRTIMSAQAQMQGMFPPLTSSDLSLNDISKSIPPIEMSKDIQREIRKMGQNTLPYNMQVVPIGTIDQNENDALMMRSSFCPSYKNKKILQRKEKKIIYFLDKINKIYGRKLMFFQGKNNTDFIYDYKYMLKGAYAFLSDYDNGRELTRFKQMGINLDKYASLCRELIELFLFQAEYSFEIVSIAVSYTVPKIIQWMDKRIKFDMDNQTDIKFYNAPKFVLYSGHDKTMVPLLMNMKKIFNISLEFPDFGANFYYELHKNDSSLGRRVNINDYYIKYVYNGKHLLTVSYNEFREKMLANIASERERNEYCIQSEWKLYSKIILAIIGYVIVIGVIFTYRQIFFKKGYRIGKNKNKSKFIEEKSEELV